MFSSHTIYGVDELEIIMALAKLLNYLAKAHRIFQIHPTAKAVGNS